MAREVSVLALAREVSVMLVAREVSVLLVVFGVQVRSIDWSAVFKSSFMLLFLAYPGVSLKVLRVFKCVTVEGTSYLVADMRLKVWTPASSCCYLLCASWSVLCASRCCFYIVVFPVGREAAVCAGAELHTCFCGLGGGGCRGGG